MATIRRFEDLEIWQEARRLSKEIIIISKDLVWAICCECH
jgi:predicted nuclease of predicted toxin-antitoxin system